MRYEKKETTTPSTSEITTSPKVTTRTPRQKKKTPTTRRVGRPSGIVKLTPKNFKDRFTKFYYLNRVRLAKERRAAYRKRRKNGVCVRCCAQLAPGSRTMCDAHTPPRKEKKEKKAGKKNA